MIAVFIGSRLMHSYLLLCLETFTQAGRRLPAQQAGLVLLWSAAVHRLPYQLAAVRMQQLQEALPTARLRLPHAINELHSSCRCRHFSSSQASARQHSGCSADHPLHGLISGVAGAAAA